MQKLENGIEVPTNSDQYNLTPDLAKMSLTANVVIPVASAAARDALPKIDGRCVIRLDLPGRPIQRCDGIRWIETQHIEFTYATTPSAIPNNSLWGPGAFTLDSGTVTTDTSLAVVSGSADQIKINQAGTYAVWFGGGFGAAVGGNSWFQIRSQDDSQVYASGPANEFWGHVSVPNLRLPADGTVLKFRLKQASGSTNNSSGRVRITKLG